MHYAVETGILMMSLNLCHRATLEFIGLSGWLHKSRDLHPNLSQSRIQRQKFGRGKMFCTRSVCYKCMQIFARRSGRRLRLRSSHTDDLSLLVTVSLCKRNLKLTSSQREEQNAFLLTCSRFIFANAAFIVDKFADTPYSSHN